MSVPDLEKVKKSLEKAEDILFTVGKLGEVHNAIVEALAELEREEKEIDYKDPKNWIAGETILKCKSFGYPCDLYLYMGNGKRLHLQSHEMGAMANDLTIYEFVCNLPDQTELK